MAKTPKPSELKKINYDPPESHWMDTPVEFKPGTFCHGTRPSYLELVDMPHAREWKSAEEDWNLPENWKEIFLEGMRDRLSKYRTFHVFMDICVRCGACADKCHFFAGGGDPKNMPVLRAELLRSIYRRYFTTPGKVLGKVAGARDLTEDVLRELWYYLYQCTECRRCSLFCPYGIDQAEITIIGRELINLLGLNTDWIMGPVSNCYHKGNHLGLEPHTLLSMFDSMLEDVETVTGVRPEVTWNRKGAEILFVTPSGDFFGMPGIYTCMGYIILFHYLGLDYTFSTYASEGGNFGFFTSNEIAKKLHYKIYAEAERLGVKWILGGECGHMWRVLNQYTTTWWKPSDSLEMPVSPITGTKFNNAKASKMVHIAEFTADLIKNNKLKFDKSRNDAFNVTFHDSCNTSRGMGILEEPRYILKNVVNKFHEMPEDTIREKTFCCGSGSGLNAGENMEIRMRGGFPRANAVKHVEDTYGVNMLANICAIDRAALASLMQYWNPMVEVGGVHEFVGNALILEGEKERTLDLREEPIPGKEEAGKEEAEDV
jgi:Fe-S oxidoreductase